MDCVVFAVAIVKFQWVRVRLGHHGVHLKLLMFSWKGMVKLTYCFDMLGFAFILN